MKKLSELGISPAPWKFTDNLIGTKKQFARGDGLMFAWLDSLHLEADARLIAAAPELYEALYEAITESCIRYCGESPIHCPKKQGDCFVQKWRAALAEAAGESEVAK